MEKRQKWRTRETERKEDGIKNEEAVEQSDEEDFVEAKSFSSDAGNGPQATKSNHVFSDDALSPERVEIIKPRYAQTVSFQPQHVEESAEYCTKIPLTRLPSTIAGTGALSLLEYVVRLSALEVMEQRSHLEISDERINVFLREEEIVKDPSTSSSTSGGATRQKAESTRDYSATPPSKQSIRNGRPSTRASFRGTPFARLAAHHDDSAQNSPLASKSTRQSPRALAYTPRKGK